MKKSILSGKGAARFKTLVLMLFAAGSFISCASFQMEGAMEGSLDGKSNIGVVKVGYSERELPIIPLIDAGFHNATVKDRMEEFIAVEEENSAVINSTLLQGVADRSGLETIEVEADATEFAVGEVPAEWAVSVMEDKNLQALVVTTTRVVTTGVTAFGLKGDNLVELDIQIFGDDGSVISEGYYKTVPLRSSPKDVDKYAENLIASNVNLESLLDMVLMK